MNKFLSKSQVGIYLSCPYKWKLIYIDGVQVPPAPQMERGKNIHQIFERFYGKLDIQRLVKNPMLEISKALEGFPQYKVWLDGFKNMEVYRLLQIIKQNKDVKTFFFPLHRELFLESQELEFHGIIDRVDKVSVDAVYIFDYKTGKSGPITSWIRKELCMYKILYEANYDVEVKKVGIIYPFDRKYPVRLCEIKKRTITATLKTLEDVRRNIEAKQFEKMEGSQCLWCDYKFYCKTQMNKLLVEF